MRAHSFLYPVFPLFLTLSSSCPYDLTPNSIHQSAVRASEEKIDLEFQFEALKSASFFSPFESHPWYKPLMVFKLVLLYSLRFQLQW